MFPTNSSIFTGSVKAYASATNPLQTVIETVLTPFGVSNANKQGIPKEEKQNIINTALHQPIKINFTGRGIAGHKDSIPIGPIVEIFEQGDDLIGKAIIWAEEFSDIAQYLKDTYAQGKAIATSWEILYADKEDLDGIQWLKGCVYAANTIVANPSYGSRTLIKSIAEKHGVTLEENENKEEAESLDTERQEIGSLQSMLMTIYHRLDELYCQTFEIEEAELEKTSTVDNFSNRLSDLISRLSVRAQSAGVVEEMAELKEQLGEAQKELAELKTEKLETARKAALAEINITLDESNKDVIMAMTDDAFEFYINSLKSVKKSVAENTNIKLPEFNTSKDITTADLKEAHNKYSKRGKI